jgi:hypothetical protein
VPWGYSPTTVFALPVKSDNQPTISSVVFPDGRKEEPEAEMNKGRLLILLTILGVLFGVAAISFFAGDAYAVGTLGVRQVTPDQLAQAMKADEFYSDFREDTLVVRGLVASVYRGTGGVILEFQTQDGAKTLCELGHHPAAIHTGNTVTAVTEGANAQRLSSGVLLGNCVVATP